MKKPLNKHDMKREIENACKELHEAIDQLEDEKITKVENTKKVTNAKDR